MKKRFAILDGFRGLFALLVAVYHYAPGPGYVGYTRFVSHSSYFTDFFFVLSGFVIYYNYQNLQPSGIGKFMIKRVIRLYPLHFFMLFVFLGVEVFKMLLFEFIPFENPPFARNDLAAFISHLFLIQSYGMPVFWGSWNAPSWSISAEFFSYIVFCITIIFIRKNKPSYKLMVYLILSAIMLLAIYLIHGDLDVKTEQFGVLRCAYSFFMGCMACICYEHINRRSVASKRLFSKLEIIFLIISVGSIMYVPIQYTFLIPISFFITILVFSFEAGFLSSILNTKIFHYLGTLSYSIYMTHYMLMFLFKIVLINMLKTQNPLLYDLMIIPYLALIIVVANFTYHNVEIKGKLFLEKKMSFNPYKADKELTHNV
ncbi:acyltransferase family protein [Larkinella harenae]